MQVFSILTPKDIKIVSVLGSYSLFRFCNRAASSGAWSSSQKPLEILEFLKKTLGMQICQINSLDKFEKKLIFSLVN